MLAKVCSAAVNGIEAYPVEVEANAGYGDTIIVIVGLPDAAVKESRDLAQPLHHARALAKHADAGVRVQQVRSWWLATEL